MTSIIKKGYQVQISSWENDADHRRTEVISGLSRADAGFYTCLANKFSMSRPDFDGSGTVNDEYLISSIASCLNKNQLVSERTKELWSISSPDEIFEQVNEMLLSWPDNDYGSRYLRTVSAIKVYWFLEDVEDVTIEFKKLMEESVV